MLAVLVFVYALFINTLANKKNQFVLEYFNFKRIPTVVGFTCNEVEDDLLLITELNSIGIGASFHKLSNATPISLLARTKYQKVGMFLDITCYQEDIIKVLIFNASNDWLFDNLRFWLILGSDLTQVLHVVDDRSFGISTDLVISIDSYSHSYDLYDVYNICKEHGGRMNVTYLGSWNKWTGMQIALEQEKFPRRSNLHRLVFKVIFSKMIHKPPDADLVEHLKEFHIPISENLNKYGYSILALLSEWSNFTLYPYEAALTRANDTFGMHSRALANNTADFTGTPFLITGLRLKHMKFVNYAWPLRTCFIFRNPQPEFIKAQGILGPFDNEIWCLTSLVVLINSLLLAFLMGRENKTDVLFEFPNTLLINIGTICQQGVFDNVVRMSTRVALLFILIFAFLIFNYYGSCVVSARLNEQIFKINDSLNEMGKLKMGMKSQYLSYFRQFLSQPGWEIERFYKKFWLNVPPAKWYMEPEVGMRLVQKGGFAYHSLPDASYPIINSLFSNTEICELMEVHLLRPSFTNFAVRFNSTITEAARVGLTKIAEVGLRHRIMLKWRNCKPVCSTDALSASPIDIYEFAPHLILLAFGTFVAGLLGVLENIIHREL